jgi:hypothetical protein
MTFKGIPTAARIIAAALLSIAAGSACTADRRIDQTAADTAAGAPDTTSSPRPADPPADEAQTSSDSLADAPWTVADTRVDRTPSGAATLREVRTARHPTYDRIVLELDGPMPGYRIAYIDRPVRQCGSGNVVPFTGDAWLSITIEPAHAHTEQGQPTVAERERTPGYPNLLELKLICDFEAVVEWVAAVGSPEPYRVFTLDAPARLVIDVRH